MSRRPLDGSRAGRRNLRCAIYTRKSTEEGLDQAFNTLDAQREACAAYIKSQTHEGWRALSDRFDDGGYSGGTIDRPALQNLLEMVQGRKVEVIVVYKIDRLTRSLMDFARLAELFDANGVSFVSVTQQFNTTTSMGRLTLNVLLSFAQFEREIAGERIRDKIAASKKKGLWMGGSVPLGYDLKNRALVVNQAEAKTVRIIFQIYLDTGSVRAVAAKAEEQGLRTKVRIGRQGERKGGGPFSRGHLYAILRNPLYVGRVRHKQNSYLGVHEAIVKSDIWEATQQRLALNRNGEHWRSKSKIPSLLAGLLFDPQGCRFTPSHASKSGRRYRYYVERALITGEQPSQAGLRRIPAYEIETLVREAAARMLADSDGLLSALGNTLTAAEMERAIQAGKALHSEITGSAPETWAERLRSILDRVILDEQQVHIRFKCQQLRSMLGLPVEGHENDLHKIKVPARVTTRGNHLKLVLGNDEPAQRECDLSLIRIVARAHGWWQQLSSGKASSIRDLAAKESVSASYVSRVVRLAFLAPDVVESILDGRQPVELSAKRLVLREYLPLDWPTQRRQLGFDPTQV